MTLLRLKHKPLYLRRYIPAVGYTGQLRQKVITPEQLHSAQTLQQLVARFIVLPVEDRLRAMTGDVPLSLFDWKSVNTRAHDFS